MSNRPRPTVKYGSLPRSIVVPTGPLEPTYAPDGLTESDIDALIAEVSSESVPGKRRPGWLSSDQVETRRARHKARQAVRSLFRANCWAAGMPGQGKSVASWDAGADLAAGPDGEAA